MKDKHRRLLGTMFDWEIAALAKTSQYQVRKERVAAGIPPVCKCCRNDVLLKRGATCRRHNPELREATEKAFVASQEAAKPRLTFAEQRERVRQLEANSQFHAGVVDRLYAMLGEQGAP